MKTYWRLLHSSVDILHTTELYTWRWLRGETLWYFFHYSENKQAKWTEETDTNDKEKTMPKKGQKERAGISVVFPSRIALYHLHPHPPKSRPLFWFLVPLIAPESFCCSYLKSLLCWEIPDPIFYTPTPTVGLTVLWCCNPFLPRAELSPMPKPLSSLLLSRWPRARTKPNRGDKIYFRSFWLSFFPWLWLPCTLMQLPGR